MEAKNSTFENLLKLDVSDHIEKKTGGKDKNGREIKLSYLSWPWAVAEMTRAYPDWSYEFVMHDGLPYVYDPASGIMVYTSVPICGETHEMWMPVMDGANNAMKFEPYEVSTKFGTKQIAAATMFDVLIEYKIT